MKYFLTISTTHVIEKREHRNKEKTGHFQQPHMTQHRVVAMNTTFFKKKKKENHTKQGLTRTKYTLFRYLISKTRSYNSKSMTILYYLRKVILTELGSKINSNA
jgi:hypothetical protein